MAHSSRLGIQDSDSARCDRSESKLLVAGKAQLAHEENIQRRTECLGDFVADRNAAAGQGENNNILAPAKFSQLVAEQTPRIAPVKKAFHPSCKQRTPLVSQCNPSVLRARAAAL